MQAGRGMQADRRRPLASLATRQAGARQGAWEGACGGCTDPSTQRRLHAAASALPCRHAEAYIHTRHAAAPDMQQRQSAAAPDTQQRNNQPLCAAHLLEAAHHQLVLASKALGSHAPQAQLVRGRHIPAGLGMGAKG